MKLKLLNLAIFQVGWTVCVLGGDNLAVAFTLLALAVHHVVVMRNRAEWWLILGVSVVGIGWDSLLIWAGILVPGGEHLLLIPLWLACLWLLFSTTLAHCLNWLGARLPLAFGLAILFGPLTYWLGGRLADVQIAVPVTGSMLIIAAGWGVMMPGALMLAGRLRT